MKLRPDFARGYGRQGDAFFRKGLFTQAIEAYKNGLEKDPDSAAMKDNLARAQARDEARRFGTGPTGGGGGVGGTDGGLESAWVWRVVG